MKYKIEIIRKQLNPDYDTQMERYGKEQLKGMYSMDSTVYRPDMFIEESVTLVELTEEQFTKLKPKIVEVLE